MAYAKVGQPTWVDLGTTDLAAAEQFYTGLFGWTKHVLQQEDVAGYTLFAVGEQVVAGAAPTLDPRIPVAWSLHIRVDDVDATAGLVEASAGQVLIDPFDAADLGRMAVFVDPSGAAISAWQPGRLRGTELFGVPGALAWCELGTPDPAAVAGFYGDVFGWTAVTGDDPMVWECGGRAFGSARPADAGVPRWIPWFEVADCDAAADMALHLGGLVAEPPADVPAGRSAVLTDPQGGAFAVAQFD